MSHDPDNKDCCCNAAGTSCGGCGCFMCECEPADSARIVWEGIKITTPVADDVEQIRARHDMDNREINENFCITQARAATHRDRATLLRIVDQQAAELASEYIEVSKNWCAIAVTRQAKIDGLRADLAVAQDRNGRYLEQVNALIETVERWQDRYDAAPRGERVCECGADFELGIYCSECGGQIQVKEQSND